MKILISYTYLKNGNIGFSDMDVESEDGKITLELITEFKQQAKQHHEAEEVAVLNVILLDG